MAMKKVLSTVAQTGARPGDVIEVDDSDKNVAAKLANGFYVEVGKGASKPAPAPAPAAATTGGGDKPDSK